jgi:YggT family protein
MHFIIHYAAVLVTLLQFAIFFRAILSWFPGAQDNALGRILIQVTEPILAPLRRIVPRMGMMDITPMAAILVLFVVQQGLAQIA